MIAVIRLVLKQYRFEVVLAVVGGAAVTLLWVFMESRIAGVSLPERCIGSVSASVDPICGPPLNALRPVVAGIGGQLLEFMRVLPFAAGLLTGVPLIARELETGTAQTAWSLFGSRRRWLARQAVIVAVPTILMMAVAAFAASSVESLRQATGDGGAVLNIGLYGIPAVIRTASAFCLGVLIGALLGRSFPALVLGGMLCFALTVALGLGRDQWLAQQPSAPIPDGTTTSMTTGFAYRTPQGTTIAEKAALALVPPDIASQDIGQVQPVQSGIWLERNGYVLAPLGVTQATAMGWARYDMLAFGIAGFASIAGTLLIVDRRRPS